MYSWTGNCCSGRHANSGCMGGSDLAGFRFWPWVNGRATLRADQASIPAIVYELDSAELDVGLAHHPAPLLHLCCHEGAKLIGRVLAKLDVERAETIDDVALAQHAVEARVELGNDGWRRPGRHKHAVPFIGFEARQRVRDRRQVGQRAEPTPAGMRDRLDRAALNVTNGGGAIAEEKLHLPTDQIVERRTAAAIGDVVELDVGAQPKQLERQVLHRAVAR